VSADTAGHPLLRDVVTERIAQAITRGELRPRERVSAGQLARELGVSRSPVREALRVLENDGLIVWEPRRGATVAAVEAQDVEHYYALRALLQEECVRLATPRVTADQIRRLEEMLAEMEVVAAAERFGEYLDLNVRFRELVETACPNPVLVELIQGLSRRARRFWWISYRAPGRLEQSLGHHRALLDAIRRADALRAGEIVRDMLLTSRDGILRTLESEASGLEPQLSGAGFTAARDGGSPDIPRHRTAFAPAPRTDAV
jgi:DNA-binding GntR family transcriptional regulator